MTLIKQCQPENVVLVHGEKSKMAFLHNKIEEEFHINCHYPANGETISIDVPIILNIDVDRNYLKRILHSDTTLDPKRYRIMQGVLKISDHNNDQLIKKTDLIKMGLKPFDINFKSFIKLDDTNSSLISEEEICQIIFDKVKW